MTHTHNNKRVQEAKLVRGYTDVKSVGKYAQGLNITAFAVDIVSTY